MSDLDVPVLEGERLRLEPLAPSHSDGMFELWSHPLVCEHSGPCEDAAGRPIELPAASHAESDRLLDFWLDRARQGTGLRWAVVLRDDEAFVGAIGFNSLGPTSEYAYHFVPARWGAGYATEASRIALSWALARGARRIEAFVEDANVRSIHLVERLGFERRREVTGGVPRYVLEADRRQT